MLSMEKLIKTFLIEQGSNTKQLAEKIGCGSANIYGKYRRNTFSVADLERIADAYNCEVEIKFVPKKG